MTHILKGYCSHPTELTAVIDLSLVSAALTTSYLKDTYSTVELQALIDMSTQINYGFV